ncbi:MAG: hypothetical protein IBX62_04640 [Coriobacteriia bacterium]|nr:hypothetical protein [Coriobacteriia bacterium]
MPDERAARRLPEERAPAPRERGGPARYARITNDFAHDMATGTWAACLLVLWVLAGRAGEAPQSAAVAIADAMRAVWLLLWAALAVLGVTGLARLAYWRRRTPAADVAAKRRALAVKHAAFLAVYGGGTAWGWSLLP